MQLSFKYLLIAGFSGLILFPGCKHQERISESSSRTSVPVTISSIRNADMHTYMELSAISEFQLKSIVKSPVTGFIETTLVNPGDVVHKNQLLFTVRTKESSALKNDTLSSFTFRGVVDVAASKEELILSIDHQKGDFVSEGDPLYLSAIPGSLVFVADVPYEFSSFVKINSSCEIILPGNQAIIGIVSSRLPLMSGNSQTERFIVRPSNTLNLPENLNGKIQVIKESVKNALSLPKPCILTDETMQNFWVMKMVSDSMAVKVPVTTGITEGNFVQLTTPLFTENDRFLASGNYGLGDTAYVKVINTADHEK